MVYLSRMLPEMQEVVNSSCIEFQGMSRSSGGGLGVFMRDDIQKPNEDEDDGADDQEDCHHDRDQLSRSLHPHQGDLLLKGQTGHAGHAEVTVSHFILQIIII
jgi:hypothetical protein